MHHREKNPIPFFSDPFSTWLKRRNFMERRKKDTRQKTTHPLTVGPILEIVPHGADSN
jgi:hypothetical protein